ncbi:MAG: carboxypeptidase-like regulatory domain-containing protein [Gemmatimonadetes bacterium]|nr:carboxypeptidase-like regulatory domain-containing protein [Gemmatimonadota bacterium]
MARCLGLTLALWFAVAVRLGPADLSAQATSAVFGRVTDATTAGAVSGAAVRIVALEREEITDAGGRFIFREVPAGLYLVTVQHLAYGTRGDSIKVEGRDALNLNIRISPVAIELDPVVVEVWTPEQYERRSRGTRVNLVTREQLKAFEGRQVTVGDVLTSLIPNVTVRTSGARVGGGLCIEFRRPVSLRDPLGCRMPLVVVDNVQVLSPANFLESLNVSDIESMEVLPASEAGVLYGTGSRYGVLRIKTREPGPQRDKQGEPRLVEPARAYDWTREPRGHAWKKVFVASAVGNLAGLGVGMLGRECIQLYGPGPTNCETAASIAAGAAAVGLSVVGSTIGATWFGTTATSAGKPLYTAMLAAAIAVPAYAVVDAARRVPNGGGEWLGGAMFMVGVPGAATLADHLFRRLRNPSSALPHR